MNLSALIEAETGEKPRPPKAFNDGQAGRGTSEGNSARKRMTVKLADHLLQALDELGGVKYLVKIGRQDPTTFLRLLSKIPVKADEGNANELMTTLAERMENAARIHTQAAISQAHSAERMAATAEQKVEQRRTDRVVAHL